MNSSKQISEIRKDYFLNRYVIITPTRSKRPRETKIIPAFENKKIKDCPLCPGQIKKNLIIKSYPSFKKQPWSVMVIKNKYPIVSLTNQKSYGQHEVVIETPDHSKELSRLSLKEIINLLNVYQDRTKELSKIKKINYILIFKNYGGKAGASLTHAHSQIFCSEVLPPDLREEFQFMRQYQKKHKTCPYCDIIRKEEKGPRKIYSNKEMIAIAPYSSAYHYETWIFPRRHLDNIVDLNKKEIISLAIFLKKILTKLFKINIPYNFFLHQVISEKNQHFYLKIQPRESIWGGLELGSGLVVNSLSPEKAASFLRK
ncbi:MAG: galactose-1-phosphate uridylyltransferase [Patescibacteria group bacterium]|jgi:UDPglucose--hexose-1-phosphate uridylyltransferase|nr:galactose-1-phosphate uridylyltransferase [Patescibacteria group bacterium]MDD5172790.1 galactose-1-phosphate uridylyltransferase [Patescibacteria group bacterium]